jgi:uncharacterized protein YndB with AHSA1/START domain
MVTESGSAHGERRQLDEALDEPMGARIPDDSPRRAARSSSLTERVQRLGRRIAVSPGRVDDQEMTENHNQNQMVVTRTVNAPAQDIFDVLTDPERHRELDGSGFIRSAQQAQRITGTGQVFTMNMTGDHMGGDYQTDNHVTGYDENQLLAWQTAPAGTEPPGWEWMWELKPQGPDATEVTLTYDWSKVTDKAILEKVTFPLVPSDGLEDSLSKLAAAVSS